MYSFATLGLLSSSIGAVLPHLSSDYNLTDLDVSFVFLVGPLGYIIAAQCSSMIHCRFGQLGIAFIGPVLQIISTGLLCSRPPFECVLFGFFVQGSSTGLLDGSWCAWAGRMERASTISGLLHGSYSVGAAAGPLLVAQLTEKYWLWYEWYYALVSSIYSIAYCLLI
jgi:fucose permease